MHGWASRSTSHVTPGSCGVSLRRHGSNRSRQVAKSFIFLSVFLWRGMIDIFASGGECETQIQEHVCWKAPSELDCRNGLSFSCVESELTAGPGSCPGS